MNEIINKESEEELTPAIIKKYICPQASDQEIFMFFQLCKAQNLNPFLREAYLIKYGTEKATIVVGKETFTKRADLLPQNDGFSAGIIVLTNNKEVMYREGSLIIIGEIILGGWAVAYRKDRTHPVRAEVSISEYTRYNKEGKPTRAWKEMPATMIRKVALVQALREAYPQDFGGMYTPEEMPIDSLSLPEYKIGHEIPPPEEGQIERPKNKSGIAQMSPAPEEQTIPEPLTPATTDHQIPTSPIETIEEIQEEAKPAPTLSDIWDVKRICEVLNAAENKTALDEAWRTLSKHIAKLDKAGKIECQKFKNAIAEVLNA